MNLDARHGPDTTVPVRLRASIIVRTFNSEKTIREVLESIYAQKFTDFELLIVDSGSTDATLAIVNEYPHRLLDISGERFSYSGSLNAGCEVAGGDYVVSLSSHCIPMHEDWLGSLVSAMDGDERLAGAWGPLYFSAGDYPIEGERGVETIDLDRFYERPNWGMQNPNAIIRRSLWDEYHFSTSIERCEDQDWIHNFLKQGYLSATVHDARVLYRIPHSPYDFGRKTMKDFIALDELFGYRPKVTVREILRQSVRLTGASIIGRKPYRVSQLMFASLLGRWVAYQNIRYHFVAEQVESSPGSKPVALYRMAARRGTRVLEARRVARNSAPSKQTSVIANLDGKTRFFLVGEMRSGTSWLSRTLNTHPEVFCKGEGSFFGSDQSTEEIPVYTGPSPSLQNAILTSEGLRTWHSLMWNGWSRDADLDSDLRNITRLTTDYFMAKDSGASKKPIVGDKSPLHTDHVDEIHALYPEAKVLHIYRDGRDVAVSLMHHFWRLSRDNRGGIFHLDPEELEKRDAYQKDPEGFLAAGNSIFTEERLRQMAVRWSRRVEKASLEGRTLFGGAFYELRYEDLLTEPEKRMKEILTTLGAAADDATVQSCVDKNRFEKLARRSAGKEDSKSFFRKGVAGDWKNTFTERDAEIYDEIAGETLKNLGYEPC